MSISVDQLQNGNLAVYDISSTVSGFSPSLLFQPTHKKPNLDSNTICCAFMAVHTRYSKTLNTPGLHKTSISITGSMLRSNDLHWSSFRRHCNKDSKHMAYVCSKQTAAQRQLKCHEIVPLLVIYQE